MQEKIKQWYALYVLLCLYEVNWYVRCRGTMLSVSHIVALVIVELYNRFPWIKKPTANFFYIIYGIVA